MPGMEPVRERQATVNDLLDRLLDKGVVVSLDLVIGVGGIPLIGVSLRAAVAAIETMIEYGFMKAWDEKTRQYAERELQRKKLAFAPGESTLLEMFGSHWYSDGIYRAWRPGRLYLTDRRLILYRKMPAEVLFETPSPSSLARRPPFTPRMSPGWKRRCAIEWGHWGWPSQRRGLSASGIARWHGLPPRRACWRRERCGTRRRVRPTSSLSGGQVGFT